MNVSVTTSAALANVFGVLLDPKTTLLIVGPTLLPAVKFRVVESEIPAYALPAKSATAVLGIWTL